MEVSIHELLAAAREAVKSDYIKGESILCETRYHPDTHYMEKCSKQALLQRSVAVEKGFLALCQTKK